MFLHRVNWLMSDRFIMAWFIEAIATPVMYCVISVNSRPIFIYIEFGDQIQSPLGFAILDKAAALGLETATPLTDPRQYINSNLGFRNLKIWLLYSKIAAVVVAKTSGNKNKTRLARPVTTWLLYPDPCFSGRAGFRNLDPSDGGWFLNPMLTVLKFEFQTLKWLNL